MNDLTEVLKDAIEQARRIEICFAASLSNRALERAGTHEEWSPKDLLAHVAAAKQRLADALADDSAGGTRSLAHDEAVVYETYADAAWTEIERFAEGATASLLARLGEIPGPQLVDPAAFAWLEGRALGAVAVGYAVTHPLTHLADFHRDSARSVTEKLVELLGSIPAALADEGVRANLSAARARQASG